MSELTKREQIAAMALQGILASNSGFYTSKVDGELAVAYAIIYADKLLAALNGQED